MSDYQNINFSIKNRVATIALSSPKTLNGFNKTMRMEMIKVIKECEDNDDVRVVILTGEGKAFSAGADLSEGLPIETPFTDQCREEYTPWLMAIHDSKKLYISAVNGVCAGIGCAAAMNCDLMIMADNAYFYQAFAAIGLMPDGGSNWLLVNKIGYSRALQLAVEAGKLTAQECLDYHITNKVVPADQLMSSAQAWAEQLAQGSPLAQTATKGLMRKASSMTYKEVIEEEAVLQTGLIRSEDGQNAVRSFFAKEKAVFTGK